jgi:hypothetical protein
MFVGHVGLALAAKKLAPRTSLGLLVAGANGLDLLWPILLLLGVERVRIEPGATPINPLVFEYYPWSHSLLMAGVWGALAGLVVWRRGGPGALIGLLVVSHWVLDLLTHVPDLPLAPGASPREGLGLWHSIPGTFLVEGALWVAGIAVYLRATRPLDRIGRFGLAGLLTLLTVMWIGQPWSAPPPTPRALAWFSLSGFLIPLWAWWADRHRTPASTAVADAGSEPAARTI